MNVPENAERVAAEIMHTLSESERWEGEFTVKRKDGSLFPVLSTLTRTYNQAGHPTGLIGVSLDLSERKEAEQERDWLLERYRLTAEATKDLLYDWDIPSDTLRFSAVIHQAYGYPLDVQDTSESWWSERVHPDDRERVDAEYDAFFESRAEAWTSEYRFQQADGSYKFVFDRGFLVRDAQGQPRRLIGAITDQTDQKASEAALKEGETRFRQLAENIQEAFWLADRHQNQMLYLSPAYETIWGRPRDEFYSQRIHFLETLHPDDRARIEAALSQQQVGGYSQEYRILRPDGTVRWIRDKAFPVHNDAGEVYRVAGIAEDITERKQAEQDLRESEARFRTLSENLPIGILLIDGDHVLYANKEIQRLTGYSFEQLQQQGIMGLIAPEQRTDAEQRKQEFLRDGKSLPAQERRIVRRDGQQPWVENTVTRIELNGRSVSLHMAKDVTDRKRVEEERKRLLQNLAERVKELSTLHQVSGLLRNEERDLQVLLDELATLLPGGWKHSSVTAVRIRVGELDAASKAFTASPWTQRVDFSTSSGRPCSLEVAYLEESSQDPFLYEEYEMLRSLSEMLRAHLDRRHAKEAIEALNADLAQRVTRLDALRQIDMAITSNLDLNVTLAQIAKQVQHSLKVDATDVFLYERSLHRLTRLAGVGFHNSRYPPLQVDLDEPYGYVARAARERRPFFIPDIRTADPPFKFQARLLEEGFVTHVALPIIAKGELHGVLSLFHRAPLDANEDWRDFAAALSLQAAIAIDNARLLEDLQQANTDLAMSYDATIEGWGRALDLKDEETAGHSRRVTELTVRLAQRLGMSDEQLLEIRRGAILHDIGKMGVPDSILLKPGKLDEGQWEKMKSHTTYAYELLAPIPFLRQALDIPYAHHEKWDGSGYPRGLKGEEIPLAARIFAVVDVYDALTSDRPYRDAWPRDKTLALIKKDAGSHFDLHIVEAFLAMIQAEGYTA